jgi:hypothetical protein
LSAELREGEISNSVTAAAMQIGSVQIVEGSDLAWPI